MNPRDDQPGLGMLSGYYPLREGSGEPLARLTGLEGRPRQKFQPAELA
jgi:hypothetical protein